MDDWLRFLTYEQYDEHYWRISYKNTAVNSRQGYATEAGARLAARRFLSQIRAATRIADNAAWFAVYRRRRLKPGIKYRLPKMSYPVDQWIAHGTQHTKQEGTTDE